MQTTKINRGDTVLATSGDECGRAGLADFPTYDRRGRLYWRVWFGNTGAMIPATDLIPDPQTGEEKINR